MPVEASSAIGSRAVDSDQTRQVHGPLSIHTDARRASRSSLIASIDMNEAATHWPPPLLAQRPAAGNPTAKFAVDRTIPAELHVSCTLKVADVFPPVQRGLRTASQHDSDYRGCKADSKRGPRFTLVRPRDPESTATPLLANGTSGYPKQASYASRRRWVGRRARPRLQFTHFPYGIVIRGALRRLTTMGRRA